MRGVISSTGNPLAASEAHSRMVVSRRKMLAAFVEWLEHEPPITDLDVEVETTVSALRQLRTLLGAVS
jgi:hypothetical protein